MLFMFGRVVWTLTFVGCRLLGQHVVVFVFDISRVHKRLQQPLNVVKGSHSLKIA